MKKLFHKIFSTTFFIENSDSYCGFAVINEEKKLIGFCTLEPYQSISTFSEAAEPMYFIDPDYTGNGVGTAVLKKLEDEAKARGIKKLVADISSENIKSIDFHKKHSFIESGNLQNVGKKFGRYFSIILMVKDLSPCL